MKCFSLLVLAVVVAASGCAAQADIEKVAIGTDVQITRRDGGVIRGSLAARDDTTVGVAVDSAIRTIPRDQIAGVQVIAQGPVEPAEPAPTEGRDITLPMLATFRELTLPQGTRLAIRLDSPVASDTSRVGDPVEATLTSALIVEGVEAAPTGSALRGTVIAVRPSGKVKGRASLALRFESISVPGRVEPLAIAAQVTVQAPATKRKDAATIAIPATGGALIGALLGGKKGAAAGTAIGGGAGTAVVLSTAGRQVRLARGTALSPRLEHDASIRVPTAAQ